MFSIVDCQERPTLSKLPLDKVRYDVGAGGQTIVSVFNGRSGWTGSPTQLKALPEHAAVHRAGEIPFLDVVSEIGNPRFRAFDRGFGARQAPYVPVVINGFQSSRVNPDRNWEINRLALIAAWGAAILDQDTEKGKPHHLVVEKDCYVRGGTSTVGAGPGTAGVMRRRTYAVADVNGDLVRGATVREINHVYGQNGLQSGNATFTTGIGGSFDDYIGTPNVVRQDQQFVSGDTKLMIEERDGTRHGTLGIYSDRNVVSINGDEGSNGDGSLRYCDQKQ